MGLGSALGGYLIFPIFSAGKIALINGLSKVASVVLGLGVGAFTGAVGGLTTEIFKQHESNKTTGEKGYDSKRIGYAILMGTIFNTIGTFMGGLPGSDFTRLENIFFTRELSIQFSAFGIISDLLYFVFTNK